MEQTSGPGRVWHQLGIAAAAADEDRDGWTGMVIVVRSNASSTPDKRMSKPESRKAALAALQDFLVLSIYAKAAAEWVYFITKMECSRSCDLKQYTISPRSIS